MAAGQECPTDPRPVRGHLERGASAMNNLDTAVKSLQGSLRDIEGQQRVLEREHARIEKALGLLTNGRPVGQITGTGITRSRAPGPELRRRRDVVAAFLGTTDRQVFTFDDFMRESEEPEELRVAYSGLFSNMAMRDELRVAKKGRGGTMTVYRVPRFETAEEL